MITLYCNLISAILPALTLGAVQSHIWRWSQVGCSEALYGFYVCIYVGQTQVNVWLYSGTQLQFCFPDCLSLSILRSQWHHVDRATNPENMSKLAVNKERASVRLNGACRPLLPLSLSLSLSDANMQATVLLTLTLTYSAHTLMPLHS